MKRNETKRNGTKPNETERNKMKQNKMKQNEMKRKYLWYTLIQNFVSNTKLLCLIQTVHSFWGNIFDSNTKLTYDRIPKFFFEIDTFCQRKVQIKSWYFLYLFVNWYEIKCNESKSYKTWIPHNEKRTSCARYESFFLIRNKSQSCA